MWRGKGETEPQPIPAGWKKIGFRKFSTRGLKMLVQPPSLPSAFPRRRAISWVFTLKKWKWRMESGGMVQKSLLPWICLMTLSYKTQRWVVFLKRRQKAWILKWCQNKGLTQKKKKKKSKWKHVPDMEGKRKTQGIMWLEKKLTTKNKQKYPDYITWHNQITIRC